MSGINFKPKKSVFAAGSTKAFLVVGVIAALVVSGVAVSTQMSSDDWRNGPDGIPFTSDDPTSAPPNVNGLDVVNPGPTPLDPLGWGYASTADYIIASRTSTIGPTTYYGCYNTTSNKWIVSFTSTVSQNVINNAIGNLTAGRTWKQTIKVIGNITLTDKITTTNYTILDLYDARIYQSNNSATAIYYPENTHHADVIGGNLTASNLNTGAGIWLATNGMSNSFNEISGVNINSYGVGLYNFARRNTFRNIQISGSASHGVYSWSSDNIFDNVDSTGNHQWGFEILDWSSFFYTCVAGSNDYGGFDFTSSASRNIVDGGYSESNSVVGMLISGSTPYDMSMQNKIKNMLFVNNNGPGIILSNSNLTLIDSNTIKNENGAFTDYPILENGTSGRNNFVNNEFINCTYAPVFLTSRDDYLAGNRINGVLFTPSSFGYTTIGASSYTPSPYLWSTNFTASSSGSLASINIYLGTATGLSVNCSLFNGATGALIAVSQTSTIVYNGWNALCFDTASLPSITSGTQYFLGVFASGAATIYADAGSANQLFIDNKGTDPITGGVNKFALKLSMYGVVI